MLRSSYSAKLCACSSKLPMHCYTSVVHCNACRLLLYTYACTNSCTTLTTWLVVLWLVINLLRLQYRPNVFGLIGWCAPCYCISCCTIYYIYTIYTTTLQSLSCRFIHLCHACSDDLNAAAAAAIAGAAIAGAACNSNWCLPHSLLRCDCGQHAVLSVLLLSRMVFASLLQQHRILVTTQLQQQPHKTQNNTARHVTCIGLS